MSVTKVIRYTTKSERAEENERLVRAVFAELSQGSGEGLRYAVFRLEDGVSFIHVVTEHDVDEPDSLQGVQAFQAFVANIAHRCDVVPVAMGATVVGGYG